MEWLYKSLFLFSLAYRLAVACHSARKRERSARYMLLLDSKKWMIGLRLILTNAFILSLLAIALAKGGLRL